MDGIAKRCGLSKGGLYAHFASKEQLFDDLLTRAIGPPDVKQFDLPKPVSVRQLAQWLVDQLYDSLAHPCTVDTMRLLMAEGRRIPHIVKLWGERVVDPLLAMLGEALRECSAAAQGAQRSIVVDEPWLVAASALHALIAQLIMGDALPFDLKHFRRVHVEMLCELLEPRSVLNAEAE